MHRFHFPEKQLSSPDVLSLDSAGGCNHNLYFVRLLDVRMLLTDRLDMPLHQSGLVPLLLLLNEYILSLFLLPYISPVSSYVLFYLKFVLSKKM